MKQILVNASQKEEIRLAVVENKELLDLDIESPSKTTKIEYIQRNNFKN